MHGNSQPSQFGPVQEIMRLLRNGKEPSEFATVIGKGVQKTAYEYQGWIIKEKTGAYYVNAGSTKWPKVFNAVFRKPKTFQWHTWHIQEMVMPFAKARLSDNFEMTRELQVKLQVIQKIRSKTEYDLHEMNFGIAKDGQLVAYDW